MEKLARKFKVICTGISGKDMMLTSKMGTLDESLLPAGKFDELISKKAIVEVKGVAKTIKKK